MVEVAGLHRHTFRNSTFSVRLAIEAMLLGAVSDTGRAQGIHGLRESGDSRSGGAGQAFTRAWV
jgi:hypothetical protein